MRIPAFVNASAYQYFRCVARKVAFAGVALASLGVFLGMWSLQWTFAVPMNPMDQATRVAMILVTHLSASFMLVGAVVIALSILIASTGYLPVRGHPALLVWTGLGLTLASVIVEIGISPVLSNQSYAPLMLGALNIGLTMRWVGGTLLGLWLTGLLTERVASRAQTHDGPATNAGSRT